MKYKKIYDRLITKAISENRSTNDTIYYENHHIIPRCMNGSDDKSNLVLLTAREHFIAHKFLTKIYPDNNSLFFAYYAMANKNPNKPNESARIKVSSKEYERLRTNFSNRITGEGNPMFGVKRTIKKSTIAKRKGKTHYNYGKNLSEETKNKISESRIKLGSGKGERNPMFGKTHTPSACRSVSIKNKGKIPHNKNVIIYNIKMSAKEASIKYNISFVELKLCLMDDNVTIDLSRLT